MARPHRFSLALPALHCRWAPAATRCWWSNARLAQLPLFHPLASPVRALSPPHIPSPTPATRPASSLLFLLSFFGTNHSSPPPPISNHPSIAFPAPRDLSTDLALDCISLQSPHTSPNVHIREQEPRSTSSLHSSTLSPNSTPQIRTPVLRPTPDPSARPFL